MCPVVEDILGECEKQQDNRDEEVLGSTQK